MRATGPLVAHFAAVENSLLRKVWSYPNQVTDFAQPGKTLQRPELSTATIPWLLQMSTLDGAKRDALQQGDLF